MRRTRSTEALFVAVIALGLIEGWGVARAGEENAAVAPLRLGPGEAVALVCATQAVLVATGAANASNGSLQLRLERTSNPGEDGRWKPVGDNGAHAASLGVMHAKTCADGCPFNIGKDDDLQLWAPAPKGVDKLAPDELLSVAVIKSATGRLKASTFRGQQIEALESGSCQRADQPASATEPPAAATPDAAAPAAPAAATPPQNADK